MTRRQQRRPRSGNRGRRTEQQEHGRSTDKSTSRGRLGVAAGVSLHVGTRLANGTVTHLTVDPYSPSPRVGQLLRKALEAALTTPAVPCPHALLADDLVVTVKSRRLLCVACAQSDPSWKRGAACDLCGGGDAVFVAVDIATRLVGFPASSASAESVTRLVASFCPPCVRAEAGLEVTP